jgi:hypothetical protein
MRRPMSLPSPRRAAAILASAIFPLLAIRSGAAEELEADILVYGDASYEGDLLPLAGVSYMIGREANTEFGERGNSNTGVSPKIQLPDGIDPYVVKGDPASTHIALGSIRMEPALMVLGQSTATAVSMAIDGATSVQEVPYEKLRERLLADGQSLE